MSWEKLLADRAVTRLPATKQELDNLRSIVTRSLRDVSAPGLSVDARSAGAYFHTFAAPEPADPAFVAISAYFDGCRIMRNVSEYEFAGGVTETDADGLLKAVKQFAIDAEAWQGPSSLAFLTL
jgi:hypothetical protein